MINELFSLKDISLVMPGRDRPILSDISYEVKKEDFIVLLGSNGSGKSSLLKLLDRRYLQTAGKLIFDGQPLSSYSSMKLAHRIKTLTQNCNESLFPSLTLFENYLIVKQQSHPNLFSLREKQELDFFADYLFPFNPNLSDKLDQSVDKLSGGEKQAFTLALTLLYPPQCLLLDEHTSALDHKTAEQLMSLTYSMIRQHKITCLLTTHDLSIAEQYGNRIIALRNGKIHQKIESPEKSLVTQHHLLAACY